MPPYPATDPQPFALGSHTGVTYDIQAQVPVRTIVLTIDDGRTLIISLRPLGSVAVAEAIEMLATLEVLPDPLR